MQQRNLVGVFNSRCCLAKRVAGADNAPLSRVKASMAPASDRSRAGKAKLTFDAKESVEPCPLEAVIGPCLAAALAVVRLRCLAG